MLLRTALEIHRLGPQRVAPATATAILRSGQIRTLDAQHRCDQTRLHRCRSGTGLRNDLLADAEFVSESSMHFIGLQATAITRPTHRTETAPFRR
jgi:hypothetical protein